MSISKEKRGIVIPKGKQVSAAYPKRAAQMMSEQYLRQSKQSTEETDTGTGYAVGQAEKAKHWAIDEVTNHMSRPMCRRKTALRERPRADFKTRPKRKAKSLVSAIKAAAGHAPQAAQYTARRQMVGRMAAQARQTAKTAMAATKQAAKAVGKAVTALVNGLIGLLGGGVLAAILCLVIALAAVAASPFGLFFAGEGGLGSSAAAGVSVAEAAAQINTAYNAKLTELQTGGYDSIHVTGAPADWPDVLAVFAVRYAGADNGIGVDTLDTDRVNKLAATFWDMTAITSEEETVYHPDSDPNDHIDDSWTEHILHITITAKTAGDMKAAYSLTDYQLSTLDELLSDRAALAALAGSR